MSKFLDENGLLYVWSKLKGMFAAKVDKVEGMALSSNDFTDAEKAKLAGLQSYTLPAASAQELGGVMVGAGLEISGGVLSAAGGGKADSVNWDDVLGKPELALKSDLSSLYRFKGSVANFASLPEQDNAVGDVWNVESSGMNYAWTGSGWDALGEVFNVEGITNAEIDSIMTGE